MTPPKPCTAKLADKFIFNDKFIKLDFEFTQPGEVPIQAGQYVSIQVSERGDRRPYSICSSPAITHGFELLIDVTPQGLGSTFLQNLALGEEIKLLAPLGVFTVPQNSEEEALVMIATGSGITPFRSMVLDQLQQKSDQREITLYWGLREERQLFWQDEFSELADEFPNFHFHPVISQPLPEWPLCKGRVTNCLSVHDLPTNAGYYLCGNAAMLEDVVSFLAERGVLKNQVHHEKFY